jgi:ADP-ribosylation factor-like protein 2
MIERSFTENARGLDNAGKTTILKRFNGEEVDTISPTLGFNIKTLEHRGYYLFLCVCMLIVIYFFS